MAKIKNKAREQRARTKNIVKAPDLTARGFSFYRI